jgi:hypothetical protein
MEMEIPSMIKTAKRISKLVEGTSKQKIAKQGTNWAWLIVSRSLKPGFLQATTMNSRRCPSFANELSLGSTRSKVFIMSALVRWM